MPKLTKVIRAIMTATVNRFCISATIVAVITLVAGIVVAVDAIAAARRCPPPVAAIEACAPLPGMPLATTPFTVSAPPHAVAPKGAVVRRS